MRQPPMGPNINHPCSIYWFLRVDALKTVPSGIGMRNGQREDYKLVPTFVPTFTAIGPAGNTKHFRLSIRGL